MKRWKEIIRRFLVWIGAAAMLLTAGCAKSPAADAAAQKNTEQIVEIALANEAAAAEAALDAHTLAGRLGAPEQYHAELSSDSGKIHITVDARVDVPDAPGMPTVRVKARDFTPAEARALYAALCGDTPMYCCQLDYSADGTEPCTGELYQVRSGSSDGKLLGTHAGILAYANPADKKTSAFFELFNNAYDLTADADWGAERGASLHYFAGRVDKGADVARMGNAQRARKHIEEESTLPSEAVGLTITPKQARTVADIFLKNAGLMDYQTAYVCLDVDPTSAVLTPDPKNNGLVRDIPRSSAYAVYCGKPVHGVIPRVVGESRYSGVGADDYENKRHSQRWYYERMVLTVTDSGIVDMKWISPTQVVETVVADTAMLSFDAIIEIFTNLMLVTQSGYDSNVDWVSRDIRINRIALEMQRIIELDSIENGLLIPVWNFYGSHVTKGAESIGGIEESGADMHDSFLSINAIDGSVINAAEGY